MFYEKNNHSGFTLNELIVVIVILGVLISLAIPRFMVTFEATIAGEGFQILESLMKAQKNFKFESSTGVFTTDPDDLDVEFSSSNFDTANITLATTDPIASIDRIGGAYTLDISEAGLIKCSTTGSFDCASIGCRGAGGECNQ